MFQEIRSVQARDLSAVQAASAKPMIAIRVDGLWREVFDVWHDSERDDELAADLLKVSKRSSAVRTFLSRPAHVLARYLVEEASSNSELEDSYAVFRECELVDVQCPIG